MDGGMRALRSHLLSEVVVDTVAFNVELICVHIAYCTDRYRLIAVPRPPGYALEHLSLCRSSSALSGVNVQCIAQHIYWRLSQLP